MPTKKIKILIIEDSKFVKTLFTGLLNQTDDIEVVGTADNESEAIKKIAELHPDIITLDAEIPDMDGSRFLNKLMSKNPIPVIMISTLDKEGSETTVRALEIGAVDYLVKPIGFEAFKDLNKLKNELVTKIHLALNASLRYHSNSDNATIKTISFESPNKSPSKVITLSASVGGVEAVKQILSSLPSNCPPVIVSLKLHESLVESFVYRLAPLCEIAVSLAKNGQKVTAGNVYLTSSSTPIHFEKSGNNYKIVMGNEPSNTPVDLMFESLANNFGNQVVGVILTGHGQDGTQGLIKIKEKGGFIICQNEASCVIYETPKYAKSKGAVNVELALEEIPSAILKKCV